MSTPLVPDKLWALAGPLLPTEPPKPRGGRPRTQDRAVLTGIIFVLKSGIPCEMLPQEMGCGSGVTCWRRHRWVIERTMDWFSQLRRLTIRYERRDDIHQAFLSLGCALICWNVLQAV